MPIPEFFKYDVRVRERMLKKGLLTESELTKHVAALADVSDLVIEVELKQPALQRESERVERVVSRSAPRPVVAHVPVVRSLENELNDIDEDDDDDLDDEDDDDDVAVKAKAAKVEAAKVEAAAKEEAEKPNGAKVESVPAPAAKEGGADDEGWESDT